jgi:hypothetical protein
LNRKACVGVSLAFSRLLLSLLLLLYLVVIGVHQILYLIEPIEERAVIDRADQPDHGTKKGKR